MKSALALIAACALAACSAPVDTSKASAAVVEFHRLQAQGDDAAIYQGAAQGLRDATNFADWLRLDTAIRMAMTHCEPAPATASTWNAYYGTIGTRITLIYRRTCSTGTLVETFVYELDHEQTKLLGYNVSGMALFPPAAPIPQPTSPGTPT